MASSLLFLLHHNDKLFTVHTLGHALIIGSRDLDRMRSFKRLMDAEYRGSRRVPNKCRFYTSDCLHICSDTERPNMVADGFDSRDISVAFFDTNMAAGVDLLHMVYGFNRAKLFMLEGFEWDPKNAYVALEGHTMECPLNPIDTPTDATRIAYLENIVNNM